MEDNFKNRYVRMEERILSHPNFSRAVALYNEQRYTLKEIAEMLDETPHNMSTYMKVARRYGMIKARRAKRNSIQENQNFQRTIELRKKNFTQEEIARILGIGVSTINGYLKRAKNLGLLDGRAKEQTEEEER